MADFLIYALREPDTGKVRYIGLSTRGVERPKTHCRPSARKRITHCGAWLRSLHERNLKPEWLILEICTDELSVSAAECFWITYYTKRGFDLVNGTDGGYSGTHTAKTREKLRSSHLKFLCKNGHPYTDESTKPGHKPGTKVCLICRDAWFVANKEKKLVYDKAYYQANRDAIIQQVVKSQRIRRARKRALAVGKV